MSTLGRRITALCVMCLTACSQGSANNATNLEREPTVRRYDNFLAAASNGGQLVSAGGNGVLVTSADGGKTWTREMLPSPSAVVAMSACPDGTFAALDFYRKVWISDALGHNWQSHSFEGNFNPLAITCAAHNRLWVIGSFSTIISSSDHGKSWSAGPPGQDAILTAMQWVDADHGFIAGEFGTFLATHDAGATWAKQAGLPADFYPYAMVFADTLRGWLSSLAGAILHTSDGGNTWAPQTNASASPIYALLKVGEQVFGVGGQVLELRGDQWVAVANSSQIPAHLAAGASLNSQALLVVGAGGALQVINMPTSVSRLTAPAIARQDQP